MVVRARSSSSPNIKAKIRREGIARLADFLFDRRPADSVAVHRRGVREKPSGAVQPERPSALRVTITVARSGDEAERQLRGEDVLAERNEAKEARVAAEELFAEGAGS